jgi:hypothetical protein
MPSGSATSVETTITGIPRWRLQEYLVELGARVTGDSRLSGEGWQARLTQVDDHGIGSLRVGRVRLEVWGDAGTVEAVRRALAPKLLRGGG